MLGAPDLWRAIFALLAGAALTGSLVISGATAAAATKPATISDITVTGETPTTATVSASVSAGTRAQTVTVEYGTASLDSSSSAGTVPAGSAKTVTAVLAGLSPDTTYHYEVQAQSSVGTTVASEQESFVTPIATIPGATPDIASAVAYLTSPATLIDGDHYEPFGPGSPDIGLTIDGALALAAAGAANASLQNMVAYVAANGDSWTGIGTEDQADGAVGKEALLAEAVGQDPRNFGGEDLIAALDTTVCTAASIGANAGCAAPGTYENGSSTFDQTLAIIAQTRAGDGGNAAAPIAYLESQQDPSGAWPSLIPSTGDSDVDSTAMAVMALALVPGQTAATAAQSADAWLVTQQQSDGGFLGASGASTNSTALAVMALKLAGSTYVPQVAAGLAFLAAQQNGDGGFNIADGDHGSDLATSTQALSGAVGTSFGTLSDPLTSTTTTTTTTPTTTTTTTTTTSTTATATVTAPTGTTTTTTVIPASEPQMTLEPTLARVSESHSRWRVGRHLVSIASAAALPVGTVFGFTLNEQATVTLAFTRTERGRKVGRKCSAVTRSNGGRPDCTRAVAVAKLSMHGHAGSDRINFDGRINRSDSLSPGRYIAVVTATANAHTSSPHALTFTIATR